MNRDEGAFLSGIYNPLFAGLRKFGGKSRVSELRVSDSQASCSDDVHSVQRHCLNVNMQLQKKCHKLNLQLHRRII
ncbi:hypothetical protein MAR_011744 [Mya arenaria]|uniref:Uncharacterized protein n=1 Tax=Mya arenaria TaxID=6604 RepID=A0ABY7FVN1_MYAAR|nr:hypothetical protein MAR_011744 [Mya arenaria]